MAGHTCSSCSFNGTLVQVVEHNRKMHVSERSQKTPCCICSRRIASRRLRLHIRRQHPSHCTVHCSTCSEPFVATIDMNTHVTNGSCKGSKRRSGNEVLHVQHLFSTSFSLGPTATTVPANFDDFLARCRPSDVNTYISRHLQTDESFRDECSRAVDHLADFFKRRPLFTVNRFIKGGSLGKGTAIKSKSDIDCVMFIDELPPIDDSSYSRVLKRYLDQMEETLRISKQSIAYDFVVEDRTKHAVKLSMQTRKKDHESHDVDLLLAKDILGPSPTSYKKAEVYAMMDRMDYRSRENCSAALVELQRDFVKHQLTTEVKNLILLVKMWKKSSVAVTTLKSYQLELLCIHVWNSLPIYSRNLATAFEAVLRKLCDYSSICAKWTDNYSMGQVPTGIAISRPLILDPANPYNNVADVCKNWPEVAAAAKRTLQKSFFK